MTLATITLHKSDPSTGNADRKTYKAPRPKTPNTASFWFEPICRDRMTGIGSTRIKMSATVFHAAWPYQNAGTFTQWPPLIVRFQKYGIGVHWKIVAASKAMTARMIEALTPWQSQVNHLIGKRSRYKKTKDIFVAPTSVL
jgi:hypothetical protein